MTGFYEIAPTRAAGPAQLLGRLALAMLVIAALAHRFGLLGSPRFILVMGAVLLVALAGLAFLAIGAVSVWRRGRPGGRRLAGAALLLALALAPFAWMAVRAAISPSVNDVTTDADDPPPFFALDRLPRPADANPVAPLDPALAAAVAAAYPDITGRRYTAGPDVVLAAVETLFAARGWTGAVVAGAPQADPVILIQARIFTPILAFPIDVVVRLADEGESTYVDLRSASLYGDADLGDNAARIRAFLADLDAEMLARAAG